MPDFDAVERQFRTRHSVVVTTNNKNIIDIISRLAEDNKIRILRTGTYVLKTLDST